MSKKKSVWYGLVHAEWRKIQYRLRRYGPDAAAKYVIGEIEERGMPITLGMRCVEAFLKRDHFAQAGRVLEQMKRHKQEHALVDELRSSWLWCCGRRKEALVFALKAAKKWKRSYLYTQLAALCGLSGDPVKERRYREQAAELARQEDERAAAESRSPAGTIR